DSDTQTFNSYNASPFNQTNQKELFESLKAAHLRGVKWVLTNHDTQLINHLYKDFNFIRIPVNRFINSQSCNRKNNTYETIITNFTLRDDQIKQINNLLFFKELKSTSYFLKDYVSWGKVNHFINQNEEIIKKWNKLKSKTEQEFYDKFELQWQELSNTFEFLPILLANNRFAKNEKFIYFNNQNQEITFDHQDKEVVINFIKESKLLTNVFVNSNFNQNIKDYIFGVLVGLDSNSRKNKSGVLLPNLIKTLLKTNNFNFQEEVLLTDILKGVELKETKRVDFVFKHNNINYLLECSFFNTSGSKINSELKRLVEFSKTINKFKNIQFIYVIEGPGLKKNASLLEKTLTETNVLFNIHRFQEFLKKIKQNCIF
ncbi:DpnII family type II restriction endonuclease, partial [Hydrangea phyllody phytoplasma]|uniref:DpnII family type II restriction endonuclease n=1 Tax=Hydrangea phyllody phytoplasma TaxID=238673 RepID=UPI0024B5A897